MDQLYDICGLCYAANMFSLLLIWLLHYANGDQEQIVKLKFTSTPINKVTTMGCESDEKFILKEGMPTKLYTVPNTTVHKFDCYPTSNDKERLNISNFTRSDGHSEATFNQLYDGELRCYFYLHKNIGFIRPEHREGSDTYVKVECQFGMHLKKTKSLTAMVNGYLLSNENVNSSKEVDAKARYFCYKNEYISVTCKKPNDIVKKLSVEYRKHDYVSGPENLNEINFEMLVDRNTSVDCVFGDDMYKTVLRVYILLNQTYDEEQVIRVNGVAIRKKNGIDGVRYSYQGDQPKVCCGKKPLGWKKSYGEGVCDIDGKNTTLILSRSIPENGIYINGLSDNRILFQTNKKMKNRYIYYAYTDDEVIELDSWYGYNHHDVNWTLIKDTKDIEVFTNNTFRYKMKKKYNKWKMIIKSSDRMQVDIVFIYKETIVFQSGCEEAAYTDEGKKPDQEEQPSQPSPSVLDNLDKHKIPIIGGCLVIIFILILIYIVVLKRKRPTKDEATTVDYVNLDRNHPDAQFPKSLNENIYLEPTLASDLYTMPVDSTEQNTVYSVPFTAKLEDMYAKPTPKRERGHKNEVTYAEIQYKEPQNVYLKVNSPQCVYAEVHPFGDIDLYATVAPKCDGAEYDNVFKGPYVNSKGGDLVEPAYCEIGALNK